MIPLSMFMSIIQDFYGPMLARHLQYNGVVLPPDTHVAFLIRPLGKSGHEYWDMVWEFHNAYNEAIKERARLIEEQGYKVVWYEYDGIAFRRPDEN